MLIRGAVLEATMFDYLVTAISGTPNILVLPRTPVVDGAAGGGLESVTVRGIDSGERRDVPAAALFVLIGAEPHTRWLAGAAATVAATS